MNSNGKSPYGSEHEPQSDDWQHEPVGLGLQLASGVIVAVLIWLVLQVLKLFGG